MLCQMVHSYQQFGQT